MLLHPTPAGKSEGPPSYYLRPLTDRPNVTPVPFCLLSDGITKSLPAKVKIKVQIAKFAAQTSSIEVDLDQPFVGAISPFQLLPGVQLGSNPTATITGVANGFSNGTIRPTGLPAGQPQWEIVPIGLVFTKTGKQLATIRIVDSLGRISTNAIEFLVKATPPKLVMTLTSLPQGLETPVYLATFVDSRNYAATSYHAQIDWGDGSQSDGVVDLVSPGNFRILGTHAFASLGSKTVRIDLTSQDGSRSTMSETVSIASQLLLDKVDVSLDSLTISTYSKLASFKSNAPATLIAQLTPTVYWGDGSSSTATIVSHGNNEFEIFAGHTYAKPATQRIVISFSDSTAALETYTANSNNSSAVWFTQSNSILSFESTSAITLLAFYGNLRGNTNAKFTAGINWNDTRIPVDRDDLVPKGNWYQIREASNYAAAGSYQPSISIRRAENGIAITIATATPVISVATMAYLPMQKTVRTTSDVSTTVARFTVSNPAMTASDLKAVVSWSDGVTSSASIVFVGNAFEVVTKRKFTGISDKLTSTINIQSAGMRNQSSAPSGGSGGGGGEGEQSSSNGTTSQGVLGNSGGNYLPVSDVSSAGCPNEFRLFIDSENYQVDSEDDAKDDKKIKQDTSGRLGKLILVNDGDANNNGTIDRDDNTNGVATLAGNVVPMTMSFSNQACGSPCTSASLQLSWDTSALRLWKSSPSGYSIMSPGSYDSTYFGLPATGGSATIQVEGLKESASVGDQSISGGFGGLRAEVRFTVDREIDADVDSNNNDKMQFPERSISEDYDENSDEKPGKIILASTLDSNGNGVPDFADGLSQFPDTQTFKLTGFVPLIIYTPKFFDKTAAKVKISYSAADPNSVTRTINSNMLGDVDYSLSSAGLMRLWTKEANSRRDSRSVHSHGDFVESGEFTISQLQPIALGRRIVLYLEGVREGEGRVSVSFDSEGNGSFETTDTVKINVAELKLVYTDISGYRQVGASTVDTIPRIDSSIEPDGIAADWQPGVEDGSLIFVRLVGTQVLDKLPGGLDESQISFGNWENNAFKQLGSSGDWTQQVNGAFYGLDDSWVDGVKGRLKANSIKVSGENFESGKKVYAGVVYRAPIEFNLSNLSDTHRTRDFRPMVKIDSMVESTAAKPIPLVIVRPAVVLVHGINDNPSVWNNAAVALNQKGFESEHFRVDHSDCFGPA